ncbi:hypothetical protein [Burkholderia ubonensis]|uniref:hypothetical protein n=1 Tax=Burkholderia ubonensis TaxID=101571 RepID=UPI000752ED5B|nr:hypothetical protein [Burkholderia ubonensis]KVD22988.1 hypothetical protein WI81_02925 [Burkholderia ubonensis]KVP39284.1 hypothetical protein WJ89_19970 [Burkholderia ubonensis]KVQ70110.1 hypothetical protein WK06_30645 [Burkholderia ubonensis]KVR12030.1 hypothetical protein WK12_14240 [Burkholderia ubonensis]KVZ32829.1 hypothetical protein WL13_26340 [Burkholderia ubonensis]
MKLRRATVALVVLVAGCSSAPANQPIARQIPPDTHTCASRASPCATRDAATSKPPVLSVGVSDPDTQLILPWFLTDIINAVNTHESSGDFLRAIRSGF